MNNQSAVCPKKSPTTKLWLGCSDGDIFLLGLRLFLLQLRLEFLQLHPKFLFCSNLHLLPRPTGSGANGAQELKSEADSPGIWGHRLHEPKFLLQFFFTQRGAQNASVQTLLLRLCHPLPGTNLFLKA